MPAYVITLLSLGVVAESIRADFNLRELSSYSSNTYQIWQFLLKRIEVKVFRKFLCQAYYLLPGKPRFRRYVSEPLKQVLIFSLETNQLIFL